MHANKKARSTKNRFPDKIYTFLPLQAAGPHGVIRSLRLLNFLKRISIQVSTRRGKRKKKKFNIHRWLPERHHQFLSQFTSNFGTVQPLGLHDGP